MLQMIDEYQGEYATLCALKISPYLFARPFKELSAMEWAEVDFDKAVWTIPKEKLTKREEEWGDHLKPLPKQAIAILKDIHQVTGNNKFVFSVSLYKSRPLSENTLNYALVRLGYKGIHSAHGFRHSADTFLHELGYNIGCLNEPHKNITPIKFNDMRRSQNRKTPIKPTIKPLISPSFTNNQ